MEEYVDHFLHTDRLMLIEEQVNQKFYCGICIKSLSPGPIYGCRPCQFYLHEGCAKLPKEIPHFFHPCPLILDKFISNFICDVCFKWGIGSPYACRRCHFCVCVGCALRPNIKSNEEIIEHFTHWHPLTLVDENRGKDLEVVCGICEELISGLDHDSVAYGCEECKFFLHRSCMMNTPQQINNHLFHPSCPLILLTTPQYKCAACEEKHSGLVFRCAKHSFQLDLKCALTPTLDHSSKDADRILFIGHQHPLLALLRDNNKADNHPCGVCREECSLEILDENPCFGCKRCHLFLHKSCMMNIPQQINNHFFHPSCPLILLPPLPSSYKCPGCDDEHVSDLAYSCRKCEFQLDVKCALAPTLDQSSKDADRILYIGHTHPLLALRNNNKADDIIASELVDHHPCGVCGEECSFEILNEAPCFGCKRCDLVLHKSCMMNTPPEINHAFHPSCPLILLTTPSSFKCAGCDDEHISRLAYSCDKCGFQLDVKCALLPTLEDQSKDADKIQHVAHKHPLLAPCDNTKDNIIASDQVDRCGVCGEKCPLESYFGCKRCQFHIHKRCAIEFTAEAEIHHPFHPLHPLTLSSTTTTNSKCGSCLGSIDEFLLAYRCAKPKCNFNLHVECAMAKPQYLVKYVGHSHLLNFFDKICAATLCHICHKVARNCIIRCVACDFNIHLYCHPSAPNTIEPKCHLHPLTLTESPFQYELISSEYQEEASESDDEFYCDICEEKRDKYESVYYCAECKRIVETRCVISELLPSVTGSDSEGHGRVISADENSALEASIAERTIGIEKLTAKKKPLELEIEKLKALEEELKSINQELEEFERDRFLWNYELNLNKEKYNSTGASTSQGLAGDLSYNDEW